MLAPFDCANVCATLDVAGALAKIRRLTYLSAPGLRACVAVGGVAGTGFALLCSLAGCT